MEHLRTSAQSTMGRAWQLALAVLVAVATGGCARDVAVPESETKLEDPARDMLMVEALLALARDGPVHITFVSDNDVIVRPLDSAGEPRALAMCEEPEPICSVGIDANLFAKRGFLTCVLDARANNVCGNGGNDYHLEFHEEDGEVDVHLHCQGDCPETEGG